MASSSSSKRKSTAPAPPAELVAIIPKERAAKIRKLKKEANQLDKEMKNDGNEAIRAKILEPLVEDAAFVAELLFNGVGPIMIPLAPFHQYSKDLACAKYQPEGAVLFMDRNLTGIGRTRHTGYVAFRKPMTSKSAWSLRPVAIDMSTSQVGIQVPAYGRTFGAHGRIHTLKAREVGLGDVVEVSLHMGHPRHVWQHLPVWAKYQEFRYRAIWQTLARLPVELGDMVVEFLCPGPALELIAEVRKLRIAAAENAKKAIGKR